MPDPMELANVADPIRAAVLPLAAWWLKGALILALGVLAARLLGRRSAAARHLAWALAIGAALAVPVASGLLPALAVPLPAERVAALVFWSDPPPDARPAGPNRPTSLRAVAAAEGEPGPMPLAASGAAAALDPAVPGAAGRFGSSLRPALALSGAAWLALWLAGAALLLGRFVTGRLGRRRVLRASGPAPETWLRLVEGAPAPLRVRRRVRLLASPRAAVPMTWGVLRPVVVLPEEARSWTLPRLRDALFHELAHVRRLDVLPQSAAELLRALAWLDPLAWIARRALCREAEHACDDAVLAAGTRASLYAGHLLEAARALRKRGGRVPAAAVAMARTSQLSDRIAAVLEEDRGRRPVRGVQVSLWLLAALAVSLPLAALAPGWTFPEPPAPPRAPAPPPLAATSGFDGTMTLSNTGDEPSEGYFTQPRYRGRCEPGLVTGRKYGTHVEADDDRWEIDLFHGSCELEIELEGEIRFSPDDRGIEWLGRGAELTIEEDAEVDRRLVVTPAPDGEPRYHWSVGGEERPFDQAARRWLAGVLPEVFRSTGLQAPERVARFLAAGGVPAVLAEIRQMSSDHVQGLYFDETLRQHRLTAAEARDLLATAGETLGSDYSLAEVLSRVPSGPLADRRTQAAFVQAASTLGSDYEAGRVLKTLLGRRDLAPETLDAVMVVTQDIGSDYELAEVLLAALEAYPRGRPVPRAFFAAAETIGSDYEHARALRAVVDRDRLDDATVAALLRSAESIGSDHELAELLVHLAGRAEIDGPLRERYLETAQGVGSRYERERVLTAIGGDADRGR